MSNDDYEIVWSDDGSHLNKNKKKNYIEVVPEKTSVKIRVEKNKRGGKLVTVVFELPENPPYFQKLAKQLKREVGVGGSFKNSTIEIQGDQRERVKQVLESKGFKVILAGG